MADTFLNNVNKDTVVELLNSTDENVKYFEEITDKLVSEQVNLLDKLMQDFYKRQKDCKKSNIPVPIEELEALYLDLSNTLYFMGDKLEKLGIHNDMSKAARQEVYNRAYLENQIKDVDKKNKTTVAENAAVAEAKAQYESVINAMYERAYKRCKFKIDAGFEMLNTIRKIISKRMQEVDLSNYRQPRSGAFGGSNDT